MKSNKAGGNLIIHQNNENREQHFQTAHRQMENFWKREVGCTTDEA